MVAADFIDENLELLTSKGANIEANELELFMYLQASYKIIQKDAPQFIKEVSFPTKENTKQYHVNSEIIDAISLRIIGESISKTSIDKLYEIDDTNNTYFAVNHNDIFFNNEMAANKEIKFVFYQMKFLKSLDSDIELPSLFDEALRLLFLSRVLEKTPSRNDRNLSIHYYKKYHAEILSVLKNSRQKYSNLSSNYQKI